MEGPASPAAGPSRRGVVLALGTSQRLAWASSDYLPAILAGPIAASLGLSRSWVFGAFSMPLLLSALLGPLVGRVIDRRGDRDVLSLSALVLAAGLLLRAVGRGPGRGSQAVSTRHLSR